MFGGEDPSYTATWVRTGRRDHCGGKAGLLQKDWKRLAQQNAPVRGKQLLGVPCVHAADLGFYSSFHGDSWFLFQYSRVVVACNVRHSQERGNASPGEQCC